ncbi:MAG: FAD-dependent oxidoreductase, partial [Verrucomicrobiota bacterium]
AATGEGEEVSWTAQHVISSAPLRELAHMLSPKPSGAVLEAASRLKYRDFITVAVILSDRDLFSDQWIYIHDPSVKVGRVQNFKAWSPEMCPDPELTCYGLEYFCFEGHDGLWAMDDAALISLAEKELVRIGLTVEEDLVDACVVRQKKAYPVYDEAYVEHVDVVRRELADRFPDLHLIGRNGMHKYNNQDHSMMTAMLCVENIVAEKTIYDLWRVNSDAAYQEDGERGESTSGLRQVPRRV